MANIKEDSGIANFNTATASSKSIIMPRILLLSMLVLMVMFFVFGLCSWYSYKHFMDAEQQELRVVEIAGVIKHIDEVLTMSAHMAAATGDPLWEQRHKAFEPQLDTAITEATSLFPDPSMIKAAYKINLANSKLIVIENEVFALVQQGDHEKATSLLNGLEYTEQKHNYSNAVSELVVALRESTQDRIVKFRSFFGGFAITTTLLGALTLLVWGIMLQMHKRLKERKQAKESIFHQFLRDQKILETSIDGFCVVSLDGEILEANSSLCKITGYSEEELLKMKITDIEVNETAEETARHIDNIMKDGYDRFETKHRQKGGKIIDVEVSSQYCDFGEEKFFFSFFRDITDFKLSTDKLRNSERLYKALCNNIPGMVYRSKSDWSTEIVSNSQIVCGYSSEDINSGKVKWFDIIHSDDREKVLNEALKLNEKSLTIIQEYRIIAKDGSVRLVEDHKISTFTRKGVFNGIDGVVFDITEPKRAEIELENYKEQVLKAQRHAYIGSMGAIVAHQVNQPLTKINILLDRTLDNVKDWSCCPDVKKDVQESLAQIKEATSIIRKFRRDSKSSALESTGNVNVSAVADRIVSVLSEKAEQAKMRIYIKGLRDLPEVITNATALEQIFLLIIQNAIEAATDQKSHRLDVTGKFVDSAIELQFADDCCGIAPENLDKIFEPFFSTRTVNGGMGLGLDIVQQILINCGGQIRVESELGKSTTFYVTLPISNALNH